MILIDRSFDKRSECISIIAKMTLEEYRSLAYESFKENGNMFGQRGVIKSGSASKIRKRMNDDFTRGAIFPQVVLGLSVLPETFSKIYDKNLTNLKLDEILKTGRKQISIIDGMQRSNIYFSNFKGNESIEIRVEFWISNNPIKLLYRMLVLNTGQVPWNTRRQIEVIYNNLAEAISAKLKICLEEKYSKINIIGIDDGGRRSKVGTFKKADVIEMYLGFSARSTKLDLPNEIAREFQRFDIIKSLDDDTNFDFFVECFAILCKLDLALDKYKEEIPKGSFKTGRDLFTKTPACVGFIVACSEYILGKVSLDRDGAVKEKRLNMINDNIMHIINNVESKNKDYMGYDTLNRVFDGLPTVRIGDSQRSLFKNVFREIINCNDIKEYETLDDFWRE